MEETRHGVLDNFPSELLCQNMNHRIIITDIDLKIRYLNGPFLGYPKSQLIHQDFKKYILDCDSLTDLIEDIKVKPIKYQHKDRMRVVMDTHILGYPEHDDPKLREGYMIIIYDGDHDINYKLQFMSNVSHEIRNPLNGILGMAQLLEHTELEMEQRNYLKVIQECGSNLLSIMNDILDTTKLEADQIIPKMSATNLHKCLEECIEILLYRASQKNMEINHNLSSQNSVPKYIITDNQRLCQILINLLGNAIKFTPSGGKVDIEILAEPLNEDDIPESSKWHKLIKKYNSSLEEEIENFLKTNDGSGSNNSSSDESNNMHKINITNPSILSLSDSYTSNSSTSGSSDINFHERIDLIKGLYILSFKIKDTGIGIHKKDYHKLFKPFTQLDQSITKEYQGTGLGLALCKKLTQLLCGDIWLEQSKVGEGSVFTFEILVREIKKDPKQTDDQIDEKLLAQKNVLVVDDDIVNRTIISDILLKRKMIPISCSNAQEANMYLKNKFKFDLALIKLQMPKVDGYTLAKKIINKGMNFPLIGISNYDLPQSTKDKIFQGLLVKPIDPKQLINETIKILKPFDEFSPHSSENINLSSNIRPTKHDLKILVVDDIKINQQILVQMLEKLNYHNISVAGNGQEAYDLMDLHKKDSPYQLILLDIKMPIMSGIEFSKKIKKQKNKPVIIAVTAVSERIENEKLITKGLINDYLIKPIKVKLLIEKIQKYCKKRRKF